MTVGYPYPPGLGDNWWGTGYFYLGPVRIPPLVPVIGMVDIAINGTVWWLFWDGVDHLMLSSTLPAGCQNYYVFQPEDGPYIGTTGLKLGVNSTPQPYNFGLTVGGEPHLQIYWPSENTFFPNAGHPIFAPNINAPLGMKVPEPSNYPAPGIPNIPGIPSSTPPPTGGGFAAFEAAYATNQPPLVTTIKLPGYYSTFHLIFYGAA